MANSYHSNGTTKWNDLTGNAFHDNGVQAFNKLTGKSYDARGVLIKKEYFDFSINTGTGISVHLIPNFKVTVYDRKITQ